MSGPFGVGAWQWNFNRGHLSGRRAPFSGSVSVDLLRLRLPAKMRGGRYEDRCREIPQATQRDIDQTFWNERIKVFTLPYIEYSKEAAGRWPGYAREDIADGTEVKKNRA